ncbi:MAG: Fur family transcriptional regulator [Armatimonadota bacterium]|nr:Fur family transcriptional regulator [Armatimonadota bacterium]
MTAQRVAVFEALQMSRDHPSAEALLRRVRRRYPTLSRASVYNALNLFTSLGLVAALDGPDGLARYDPGTLPHANVVCVRCGAIDDVTDPGIPALLRRAAGRSGFVLEPYLTVRGLCPACARTPHGKDRRRIHGTARTRYRRTERR